MSNNPLMFCHTGWMNRYEGDTNTADRLIGGGAHVERTGSGGEICNFLGCPDGYVYGHVETYKGVGKAAIDQRIHIEKLGNVNNKDNSVSPVDVIWTARNPKIGGRHVIGWYRNATVFGERQYFSKRSEYAGSLKHKQNRITNFRIRAEIANAVLLPVEERVLKLKYQTEGWMGHAPRWYPEEKIRKHPEIGKFLNKVRAQMNQIYVPTGDEERVSDDIGQINGDKNIGNTEKQALINARIGQGKFRNDLFRAWGSACALTGCGEQKLLRASHIKPWRRSNNKERLAPANGLLLVGSLDLAFDAGLVSFSASGKVMISKNLSAKDRKILGVSEGQSLRRAPSSEQKRHLKYHRENVFQKA